MSDTPALAVPCGGSAAKAKPEPVAVAFTVGNTYRRLAPSEASYDKLTGRHLKIHDWTLYVDVLAGQDPDIIDRVTFDMRDDSFATTAFTCHCPIRIKNNLGSSFIGRISGIDNQNNSQKQIGQSTKEEKEAGKSEREAAVIIRPHPNQSRWRFSTRQQTYGPVDVQINIRGRGGCRCTVPYKVVLNPGGYECPVDSLPLFVEKRPHQLLKPLKMMDSQFALEMYFGLDGRIATSSSLYETAKSVYSRSKLPIRLLLEDGFEDFSNKPSSNKQSSGAGPSTPWVVKLVLSASSAFEISKDDAAEIISVSSPALSGGHGLNECYKIIEGLPQSCILLNPSGSKHCASVSTTSIHVQIDVSKLSLQQIIKVCQNFIKYEEAIDSIMPWHRRENRCHNCRSNKQAMKGDTNKERNQRISKCETLRELVHFLNPTNNHYKLNLRRLVGDNSHQSYPNQSIEFRQHPSSKDKTTVTHWIRFCTAFVRNSARLRAPMALKATTSLEEEFDLLIEYVVKDRALRNFYRERRDAMIAEEEMERTFQLEESAMRKSASDSMSISDSSSGEGSRMHLPSVCKRSDSSHQSESRKRAR
mmetsp:Transcript_17532/g.37031  ORF Transcript_17532/g.37031 Transcript_17532/m.37031 type:complete len:587 (-) Transcript_17532:711-2471(-)